MLPAPRKPRRRHEIPIFRIRVRRHFRLTPPREWEPLTEEEWLEIGGYLAIHDCGMSFTRPHRGRPIADVRARLDAIFRAVTLKHPDGGRATWTQLSPHHGKHDTINRSWRRWGQRGLWERLLIECCGPHASALMQRLAYWICCAFRRTGARMTLRQVLLARHLGLLTALAGPLWACPDPILSATVMRCHEALRRTGFDAPDHPDLPELRAGMELVARAMAMKRFARAWEPA